MSRHPECLMLEAQLIGQSLAEVAARARDTWEAAGLSRLAGWGVEARSPAAQPPPEAFGAAGLSFEVEGGWTGVVVPVGTSGTRFDIRLPVAVTPDPVALIPERVAAARRRLASLGPGTGVASMSLRRGIGANCLPLVPMVAPDAIFVWLRRTRIEDAYTTVDAFLAAFDQSEIADGFVLGLRGARAFDTVAWLKVAMASQWALARAARDGRTVHRPATPLPEEVAVYRAGPETLHPAAYDAETSLITYTAWTPDDTHLSGFEIDGLHDLLLRGTTPDGRPVKAIRVVFPDEAAARREARPLFDLGVRVSFAGPDGVFHALDGR
jgi:hypothetical protein